MTANPFGAGRHFDDAVCGFYPIRDEFMQTALRKILLTNTCNTCIIEAWNGVVIMPMKPREMIELLGKNGYEFVSANGSHRKY